MTQALRIGIAGLGTVGAGVVKILAARGSHLASASGREIKLVAVTARDKTKDRGIDLTGVRWEDDPMALASANDIDLVIELIGGSEGVARDLVEASLKAGKHVATANKALIAHHGTALARLAEAGNVALNYEAAVAGGIPIVKAMREALAGVAKHAPVVPVVANVVVQPISDPDEIAARLVEQVTGRVRWRETVEWFAANGVTRLYEIGAGKVLSGLARRIDRNISTANVGVPADIEAFLSE